MGYWHACYDAVAFRGGEEVDTIGPYENNRC